MEKLQFINNQNIQRKNIQKSSAPTSNFWEMVDKLIPNFNPVVASKRREKDIMKLLMSDYNVTQSKDNSSDFHILFKGPANSYYENGVWSVHVLLPDQYPYKSPSIGFSNKIYHPNVDEASGSVCLDVINQAWSPMFDLINVFDIFLPQLLQYPNPSDPLNPEAAALMMNFKDKYEQKVKEYVQKYAMNTSYNQEIKQENNNSAQQPIKHKNSTAMEEDKQLQQQNNLNQQEQEEISSVSMDNVSELSEQSFKNDLNEEVNNY